MQKVDVAIVGGGPAGLSAAISIKRACKNVNVKVFERVDALVARGAGLRLEANGWKALHAISPDLCSQIRKKSTNPHKAVQFDSDGGLSVELPLALQLEAERKDFGQPHGFIGWSELQMALADFLPADVLQLGWPYQSLAMEDDGVLLDFGDDRPQVKAAVVIGADGYRSRVRQQWLDDGGPMFTDAVIWRGFIPAELSSVPYDHLALDMRSQRSASIYSGPPGVMVWNASAPVSAMEEKGVPHRAGSKSADTSLHVREAESQASGSVLKERALRVFADLPPQFGEVIAATDPSVMMEHDLCIHPSWEFPESRFGEGPVTLAGDAAHAIRPTGQGTNQALEDALALGHAIGAAGPVEEALRAYEAARLPRWTRSAVISESLANITTNNKGSLSWVGEVDKLMDGETARNYLWGVELKPLVAS